MRGVFVGMACLDVVLHADHPPTHDEKVTAEQQDITPGGPATNAARTCAALGGDAILITALGSHPVARMLKESLAGDQVEVIDLCPEDPQPPPVASVVVSANGERAIVSQSPDRDRLPIPGLPACEVLLSDGHLADIAIPLARTAAERRLPVVVDAGRPKPVFEELFPVATDVICSAGWTGEDLTGLLSARTELVAVTAGAGPVRWWTHEGHGEIAVPTVDVVNTLGAGDVLHGAHAFWRGHQVAPVRCLAHAVELASARCVHRTMGAWLSTMTSASSDPAVGTPSPTSGSPTNA